MVDYTKIPNWAAEDTRGMYLFGSRSMTVRDNYNSVKYGGFDIEKIRSNITSKTDYDIAGPYSMEIEENLLLNGWNKINPDGVYTPCPLLRMIFSKKVGQDTVQIILRDNHELFVKTWDNIEPEFWYYYIWKSSPEFKFKLFDKRKQKEIIRDIITQFYYQAGEKYGYKLKQKVELT